MVNYFVVYSFRDILVKLNERFENFYVTLSNLQIDNFIHSCIVNLLNFKETFGSDLNSKIWVVTYYLTKHQ